MSYGRIHFRNELKNFKEFIRKEYNFRRNRCHHNLTKNSIIRVLGDNDKIIDNIVCVFASFDEDFISIQITRKKGNEEITESANLLLPFDRTILSRSKDDGYNDYLDNHIDIYTDERNKSQIFLKYIYEFLAVYRSYTGRGVEFIPDENY